jgi:hypothetical protein
MNAGLALLLNHSLKGVFMLKDGNFGKAVGGIWTPQHSWRSVHGDRLCRGVIGQFHAVHSIMMVPFLPMR